MTQSDGGHLLQCTVLSYYFSMLIGRNMHANFLLKGMKPWNVYHINCYNVVVHADRRLSPLESWSGDLLRGFTARSCAKSGTRMYLEGPLRF